MGPTADGLRFRVMRLPALTGLCLLTLAGSLCADEQLPDRVSYNRHIREILSANCLSCHGPDENAREADLRLDDAESALAGAIVPGHPEESELLRRVLSEDPDERMPPPESKKAITSQEAALLRQWIIEGAEYEAHWSFVPPRQADVPVVKNSAWPRNPIDNFILARLEREGLEPATEADRYTLVRRLYLDLLGLPPTPRQADAFVNDRSPDAYERLVDDLLASPRYGERWARRWLDLARYADTNGYEKDRHRVVWPYRDWAIHALNADMPFDRFTVEQLAGDMLPDPTVDQLVATGFHRNTMLNEEGGIDPLEFRFYSLVDRVNTTSTVWLGLTLGCAQCHTHKYDPISHTEYYRMMAFLNNVEEPKLDIPDVGLISDRETLQARIDALREALPDQWPVDHAGTTQPAREAFRAAFELWVAETRESSVNWYVIVPGEIRANLAYFDRLDDGSVLAGGDVSKRDVYQMTFRGEFAGSTALRLEALPDPILPAHGPGRTYYEGREGDFFLSELTVSANGTSLPITTASATHAKLAIGGGDASAARAVDGDPVTGWSASGHEGRRTVAVFEFAEPLPDVAELQMQMVFERHYAAPLGRFRLSLTTNDTPGTATDLTADLVQTLANGEAIDEQAERRLMNYFADVAPQLAEARKAIDEVTSQLPTLPTAMIFQERPDGRERMTYRHHRGEFLQPKEAVSPGVPEVLHGWPEDVKADRLAFAGWLVDPANPLVGRVTMNRTWERLFGRGIVETVDDFGLPGAAPSHPELLDWLAVEFVRQDWSMKRMHRLMVTSSTYRQSSTASPQHVAVDPEDRLLGRAPRFRLDAELLRDYALVASGRLSDKLGGPSVFPPQPASITTDGAYGKLQWEVSTGEDRYRRGLYTYAKRTAPFAAFNTFDAPSGEACVARRPPSNTPLQALTLLNDEMFLELAMLAGQEVAKPDDDMRSRLVTLFRRCLTRPPSDEELSMLTEFYDEQARRISVGEVSALRMSADVPPLSVEASALALTARALLNLDEAVTRH